MNSGFKSFHSADRDRYFAKKNLNLKDYEKRENQLFLLEALHSAYNKGINFKTFCRSIPNDVILE